MLTEIEGISFKTSPMDFFILLARYKFAARLLKPHSRVVDVGCGKGYGSVFLSQFAKEVVAVDHDKTLVEENRQEHSDVDNLSFNEMDLLAPSAEFCNRFDVVVSMDVIEHFDPSQVDLAMQGYSSLLVSDGFAVIGTPNVASRGFASKRRLETHPFEFSATEFEERLNVHFNNVFLFSMTDEIVSTQFNGLSWYLMAICTK